MKKLISLFNWDYKDVLKVLIGSFMFCYSVNVFIVPNNLYTGGVLGIAQLIRSIIIVSATMINMFDKNRCRFTIRPILMKKRLMKTS